MSTGALLQCIFHSAWYMYCMFLFLRLTYMYSDIHVVRFGQLFYCKLYINVHYKLYMYITVHYKLYITVHYYTLQYSITTYTLLHVHVQCTLL